MSDSDTSDLKQTPLTALHRELGARLVPFAGYEMPVQYPLGVLKEHEHTRAAAGLFDVSHMGQAFLHDDGEDAAKALESLTPGSLQELKPGRMRYTLLLNENGGILDDLMVTRPAETDLAGRLYIVVNAACKAEDFAIINEKLAGRARLEPLEDRALVALQGPKAAEVLARLNPACRELVFMSMARMEIAGADCLVSRSGYTGEDGFEISIPADKAEAVVRRILDEDEVEPIGLGARDSLRLEAGLCLYGHDLDTETTPIEASLIWAIGKRRRTEGGFPGAETILKQMEKGVTRKRVGLKPEGRAPVREGVELQDDAGRVIGRVTSGGFGPTAGGPIAMGYLEADFAKVGTTVQASVRGKPRPCEVVAMPFIQQRYAK